MPNTYLYPGEANPAHVVLSDPTQPRSGAGAYNVTGAGGIPSAEAFGQPTITLVHSITGAGAIPSGEAFGTAILELRVSPAGIPTAETFGSPTVTLGGITILVFPVGIPSEEAFGTPGIVAYYEPLPSIPAHLIEGQGGGGGEAPARPKPKMYPLSGDRPFRPRNMSGDRWKRSLGKKPFKGL